MRQLQKVIVAGSLPKDSVLTKKGLSFSVQVEESGQEVSTQACLLTGSTEVLRAARTKLVRGAGVRAWGRLTGTKVLAVENWDIVSLEE